MVVSPVGIESYAQSLIRTPDALGLRYELERSPVGGSRVEEAQARAMGRRDGEGSLVIIIIAGIIIIINIIIIIARNGVGSREASGCLPSGLVFYRRQEGVDEGILERRSYLTGSSAGYEDREADSVVRGEDQASAVEADVTVFGVEICDAVVGILDAEYLPRESDGLVRVRSVSYRL